jgi:hypothetical protein
MKKLTSILFIVLMLCLALVMPAFANVTFVVPSGIGQAIDRDGNTYTPSATGTISVPNRYEADFINAGYVPQTINAIVCGSALACSVTNQPATMVVTGKLTLSNASASLTGLSFTSATTYLCTANDITATNAVRISVPYSGSMVGFFGTGSDTINYMCVGY